MGTMIEADREFGDVDRIPVIWARIATGRGLNLLFSGPFGTGKTMTAGVVARDQG